MKEKLAMDLAGESTTRIVALDGTTAEDVVNKRNIEKFNQQVDNWAEKFEKHSTNIKEFADKINSDVENIEIMPIGNYLLVKPFNENPFQRIVRDSKSGLIIDTGGFAPEYKNTDNGQIEEEEQFIKVGVVQESGYRCEAIIPGDTVFYTKVSAVPVPFYKQGLELINETRVLAVVNKNLTERFKNLKNDK
jgi:hypothetical protein